MNKNRKHIFTNPFVINLIGIIIYFCFVKVYAKNDKSTSKGIYTVYKTNEKLKLLNTTSDCTSPSIGNSKLIYSGLSDEGSLYPSNNLYENSWNTEFLTAYTDLEIPDSFVFDVSNLKLPIEGKITSHFGPRGKRFHYGTDIQLRIGDTIRAVFDGQVRVMKYERKGFGYYLVLRHFNGLETVYGHLSKFLVKQCQKVKGGDPIALGGNTGSATGPHLHFEFRFLGVAINAEEIINFEELIIKDNIYVFRKGRQNYIDAYHSINQCNQSDNECEKAQYHRIINGDTLYSISKKYKISIEQLCKVNKIDIESKLFVGNDILIS